MSEPILIGKGSYGCLYKPSITCHHSSENVASDFDYSKYVSKLTKDTEAVRESSEIDKINQIDQEEKYHLGESFVCKPKINRGEYRRILSECNPITTIPPTELRILLIKDGGKSLYDYIKELNVSPRVANYLSENKDTIVDKFLIGAYNLFIGLRDFKAAGLVHNDIKPQNILIDPETGKMVFIDFGQMKTKAELVDLSNRSVNTNGQYHWSFPLACGLMNKNSYIIYQKFDEPNRIEYIKLLNDAIMNGQTDPAINKDVKRYMSFPHPENFEVIIKYFGLPWPKPITQEAADFMMDTITDRFYEGMVQHMSTETAELEKYDEFLDRTIDGIDIFGLGFTLEFCIRNLYPLGVVELSKVEILVKFFQEMRSYNICNQKINIEEVLAEYTGILVGLGVLERQNKTIENYRIIDKEPEQTELTMLKPQPLSPELEKVAEEDPSIVGGAEAGGAEAGGAEETEISKVPQISLSSNSKGGTSKIRKLIKKRCSKSRKRSIKSRKRCSKSRKRSTKSKNRKKII
jgi:serine/threonine protein kinase